MCLEHVERLRVAGVAILTVDAFAGVDRAAVLLQMSIPDSAMGNGLLVESHVAVQARALARSSSADCERNEQSDERAAKPLSTRSELG